MATDRTVAAQSSSGRASGSSLGMQSRVPPRTWGCRTCTLAGPLGDLCAHQRLRNTTGAAPGGRTAEAAGTDARERLPRFASRPHRAPAVQPRSCGSASLCPAPRLRDEASHSAWLTGSRGAGGPWHSVRCEAGVLTQRVRRSREQRRPGGPGGPSPVSARGRVQQRTERRTEPRARRPGEAKQRGRGRPRALSSAGLS